MVAFLAGTLFLPGRGDDGPPSTTMQLVLLAIYIASGLWLWHLARRPQAVTVTPSGIRPRLQDDVVVPASLISGLEVCGWTFRIPLSGRPDFSIRQSVRLVDGRFVALPALLQVQVDGTRGQTVLVSTSEHPEWTPLLGSNGRPLRWSDGANAELTEVLSARVDAILDRSHASDVAIESLALPTLEGKPTGRWYSGARWRIRWQSQPFAQRSAAPRDPNAPGDFSPLPVPPPTAVTAPRTGGQVPDWTDLDLPISYWSRVNERQPSLFGKRPLLRFETDGVVLQRHRSRRVVAYDEIDAFEIHRSPSSGLWRPTLVTIDDEQLDLPGVIRGTKNALCWSSSDRRDSMPWGPDDDDLVVARLNAQLAVVRGATVPRT